MATDAEDRARNRSLWAEVNAQHTDAAAEAAWQRPALGWGLFGIPESELEAVGEVRGLRVVELGCGTAYVSALLARGGATVVALDLSEAQLASARRCQDVVGPRFPLVQGDGEAVPLKDAWADLVVSEHGVGVWCDPRRWVAEAARLLRPGGRLVVLVNSLLSALCVPDAEGLAGDRLQRGQRDVERIRWSGGGVEHHLSHGGWITAFGTHGFVVERLLELYPPAGADDPAYYEIVSAAWAARWPAEEMWIARRT